MLGMCKDLFKFEISAFQGWTLWYFFVGEIFLVRTKAKDVIVSVKQSYLSVFNFFLLKGVFLVVFWAIGLVWSVCIA